MVTEINVEQYETLTGIIADALKCERSAVRDITILKKGMTNRSFLFSVSGDNSYQGRRFILRIPGEGTDRLINREQEAEVFRTISGLGLCDDPVYIDPKKGIKITAFLAGARTCDPHDENDLIRCMAKLRTLHEMHLKVPHTFDIFEQLDFYESLRSRESIYPDYSTVKANIMSLRSFIDSLDKDWTLTHIDAVPDNFLFYMPQVKYDVVTDSDMSEKSRQSADEALQLTDWEYAGMQDPHVDIAMFCIYSLYDRGECDRLIDIYFDGKCDSVTRAKIYAYIAACGLLWSNWCEFKQRLGVEFGEYSERQYRYAVDFYSFTKELTDD